MTYAELGREPLATMLPALAQAARTVGSPQIRNTATIGGNLATCSPAGDGLPVLAALDAVVELVGPDGVRTMPVGEFMTGVKRTALRPGELIAAVTLPLLDGWQGYAKVGVRNAMVIAIAGVCLAVDRPTRTRSASPSARSPRRSCAPPTPRRSPRRPSTGRRDRSRPTPSPASASSPPPRAVRSTTTGRPRRIDAALSRCWPADSSVGPSRRATVAEHYSLHVNGAAHDVADAWLGESLLYVLRERLGLLGAKGACEQGECGSCSVLVDGDLVCSCLVLAASAVDVPIVTIEGLAEPGAPTDVQRAFVEAGAVQCGFCTPGLVMAAHDLLERIPQPTVTEIREELSGNICRCTGYGRLIAAVQQVAVERSDS